MKAIGRGGGEGWDKEEGKGKGEGKEGKKERREAHPPVFSNTPQFEISGNKPDCKGNDGELFENYVFLFVRYRLTEWR
jgi:hypothetical protein